MFDAKAKFSEMVQRAVENGPQVITKRGEPTAVVLSIEQYRQLTQPRSSFKDFLTSGPSWEGLEIERANTGVRELDL